MWGQHRHPLQSADQPLQVLAVGAAQHEVEVLQCPGGPCGVDAHAPRVNTVAIVCELGEIPQVTVEFKDGHPHWCL